MRLSLEIDFWDQSIGAFEPVKVLRQVCRAFPEAEVDWTDQQELRLCRELEGWSKSNLDEATRERLMRQSKDLYRSNGPTYRFQIPLGDNLCASGWARRLSIGFELPDNAPMELRDKLTRFLESVRMGEPKLKGR
jgi:hypothetical protein